MVKSSESMNYSFQPQEMPLLKAWNKWFILFYAPDPRAHILPRLPWWKYLLGHSVNKSQVPLECFLAPHFVYFYTVYQGPIPLILQSQKLLLLCRFNNGWVFFWNV